jgi:uncharacterized phage protein (TIGR02218 family)
MKTLPDGMQAHLDSGATTLAWCWRLTRTDGLALGFTDHDRDLAFDGTDFEAGSGFTGSEIKQSLGLSVDNLDVSGALNSQRLNETDLAGGLFDDARVEIWRVNWTATGQRVLVTAGSVGEVKRAEGAFTAELRSLAHYLAQEKGRTYQYACDAALGDDRCGVDLSDPAFLGTGTVTLAESAYLFRASGLGAFAADWFAGGLVTWTSGVNANRAMEVKRHALLAGGEAEIELWRSMASPIAPGDAFTITAGCDKTFTTCKAKFANGVNFRGFPQIPGNAYVMSYPAPGDPNNDGGSRNP